MRFGCRLVLILYILLLPLCSPEKQSLPFTITHHNIKLQCDPAACDLTAIDTISIQYEKNIDRIYFLLHPALPRVHSTFTLTMLIPHAYHASAPGNVRLEETDDVRRLYQRDVPQQPFCQLYLEE